MAEIKLQKRAVYVADVYAALVKAGYEDASYFIQGLPSANVATVVRCKDCVHVTNICLRNGAVLYKCNRFYEQYGEAGLGCGFWDGPAPVMSPEGFCSDGERRREHG